MPINKRLSGSRGTSTFEQYSPGVGDVVVVGRGSYRDPYLSITGVFTGEVASGKPLLRVTGCYGLGPIRPTVCVNTTTLALPVGTMVVKIVRVTPPEHEISAPEIEVEVILCPEEYRTYVRYNSEFDDGLYELVLDFHNSSATALDTWKNKSSRRRDLVEPLWEKIRKAL